MIEWRVKTEMVEIEPENQLFQRNGTKWANLHEHFPDDDIVVILEHCAEHNSYSVFLSLNIPETQTQVRCELDYKLCARGVVYINIYVYLK